MERLSYHLDKTLNTPLYLQLYQQIRDLIYQEALVLGDKLPSKRYLSDYLNISQNTVESAYGQLVAEGYIESVSRRGFFVCFQPKLFFNKNTTALSNIVPNNSPSFAFDFNPHYIDTRHFPLNRWRKVGNTLFQTNSSLLSLGSKQGDIGLRYEICRYLFSSRGVSCQPEQIVIGAGLEICIQQLILLFNQLYQDQPVQYGMEFYGYATIEKLLKLYQQKIVKLPLNQDNQQLNLKFLFDSEVNIACVTPSHLFPFGHVLSITQREQLLTWAKEKPNRYIIEDDYDSEFRYKGKPIPALQSLDKNDSVIYLGSFSKLLMPSIRLSFMVLPNHLLALYQQHCGFLNCSVSRFEQQRLANFIQQGDFEKHISRMRKIYRRKMELLCKVLQPYHQDIRYYGEDSGFYLLVEVVNKKYSMEELIHLANKSSIKVYPVHYTDRKLFSLGFGDLSEEQLMLGINKLLSIWLDD